MALWTVAQLKVRHTHTRLTRRNGVRLAVSLIRDGITS